MSTRFRQANVLVKAARRRLGEVHALGTQFLKDPTEENLDTLKEATQEVLVKLRSALDFCASELFERCIGRRPGERDKIYFPIAEKGSTPAEFRGYVGKKYPGFRTDLLALLESFQEFTSPRNYWLPDLRALTNKGKHDEFSRQDCVEEGGIIFSNVTLLGPGAKKNQQDGANPKAGPTGADPPFVILFHDIFYDDPGENPCKHLAIDSCGSLTLPPGAELRAEGIRIPGPRVILGKSPYLRPEGPDVPQVRALKFATVRFELNDRPASMFLKDAVDGTEHIVRELSAKD